eukprot:scaffold643426_cov41-Prasinocladus_malaysianus.AAC.1
MSHCIVNSLINNSMKEATMAFSGWSAEQIIRPSPETADDGEFCVRTYFRWSSAEEDELRRAVEKFGRKDWDLMRKCPEFKLL